LKSNRQAVLVLTVLVVVFPWIVANIAANLKLAQMSGWQSFQSASLFIEERSKDSSPWMDARQYASSQNPIYTEYVAFVMCGVLASA